MLTGIDDVVVGTVDHAVLFYSSDAALGAAVAEHLAEGLLPGRRALALATGEHRAVIERALEDLGVDLPAVRATGRLVLLDAADVLTVLTVDGRLDAGRFRELVGELVSALAADGASLQVFGDLMALLWEAGQGDEALALEGLWEHLREEAPVQLLCAYPAPAADDRSGSAAIRTVHTHVLAEPQPEPASEHAASRGFAPTPSSARVARRFVADVLTGWGRAELVDTTALVVGELVGNAIRHGGSRYRVTVSCDETGLRVEVTDLSSSVPEVRPDTQEGTGGRGLHLVEALSRRWGTDVHDDGKTVWAEIPASA